MSKSNWRKDSFFELRSNWDTQGESDIDMVKKEKLDPNTGKTKVSWEIDDVDPIEEVLCALERGEVDQFLSVNPEPSEGFREAGSLWEGAVLPLDDGFVMIPPSDRLTKIRKKIFGK